MGGRGQLSGASRALTALAVVAGLVFVLTQLTGSDTDKHAMQTIGTALALLLFTISGSAGLALVRLKPRGALLGVVTAMLSLLAFGAFVVSIWKSGSFGFGFGREETAAKVGGVTILLALTSAAASALLATARDEDEGGILLARLAAIGGLALLVAMAILSIIVTSVDIGARAFAIVATVYVVSGVLLLLLRLLPSERG